MAHCISTAFGWAFQECKPWNWIRLEGVFDHLTPSCLSRTWWIFAFLIGIARAGATLQSWFGKRAGCSGTCRTGAAKVCAYQLFNGRAGAIATGAICRGPEERREAAHYGCHAEFQCDEQQGRAAADP